MSVAHHPTPCCAAERAEQLARLVYELLDAHADTQRLAHCATDHEWQLHLHYLRDLQRTGREVLAHGANR
jgi:hypothetical protein